MKLSELESNIGTAFPQKWHSIYETGAMEWLELSQPEFRENRQRYINDPSSFLMLDCDCEPIFFYEISEYLGELNEWLLWKKDSDGSVLNEDVKLIPFAKMGTGDIYCFVYTAKASEPSVALVLHDDCDTPEIIADSFDDFLYTAMLGAAASGENTEGEHWKAHLEYLSDKNKARLWGRSPKELADEFESMRFKKADIFR